MGSYQGVIPLGRTKFFGIILVYIICTCVLEVTKFNHLFKGL
jgi:hypothetical protein